MNYLELEKALIDFYKVDADDDARRHVWKWSRSTRIFISVQNVDFWIEIFKPEALETDRNRVKITASHASTVSYNLPISEASIETIDAKLKDFVDRRKKKLDKKLIKIENILDYVKYKLYEHGVKYTNHGKYIIISNPAPFSWYISYEKANDKTGEECLTLMFNSPVHGRTYRLDGSLADPNNKIMEQVFDIIEYTERWNTLIEKHKWHGFR